MILPLAAILLLAVWNAPWTTSVTDISEFTQLCATTKEAQYFYGICSRQLPLEREMWEPQLQCHNGSSNTRFITVQNNTKKLNIEKVWRGLTRTANLKNFSSAKPVALGFGVCKDVIVDAVVLLNTLVKEGMIDDKDIKAVHHDEVGVMLFFSL